MKSFDEKLESLDVAPRYLDHNVLTMLRRDSVTNRIKKDNSPIFFKKRERFESGDSLNLPNDHLLRKESICSFQNTNQTDRFSFWPAIISGNINNKSNSNEPQPLNTDPSNVKFLEEESVIDHQLTAENNEYEQPSLLDNNIIEKDINKPLGKLIKENKEESNFTIKVKRSDTRIIANSQSNNSYNYEYINEYKNIGNEVQEEKSNNFIFTDEVSRLKAKIVKVSTYWNQTSLLIPNVFRLLKLIDEDKENYLEFQEYSKKELLVQSNGQKFIPSIGKSKDEKNLKRTKNDKILNFTNSV